MNGQRPSVDAEIRMLFRTSPPRMTPGWGDWADANNVELAYTQHHASWLNRIEAQFTALRYFCLDGTDHESHKARTKSYVNWSSPQTLFDSALAPTLPRARRNVIRAPKVRT